MERKTGYESSNNSHELDQDIISEMQHIVNSGDLNIVAQNFGNSSLSQKQCMNQENTSDPTNAS